MYKMCLTYFSVRLGFYEAEFLQTPTYIDLFISRPTSESQAMTLRSPALWYIHFVLSHTLTSHGDSTGIINRRDFDFLLCMLDRFYLHLGYDVVVSIAHQGMDPCISTLFVGPYITLMIRGMGIL